MVARKVPKARMHYTYHEDFKPGYAVRRSADGYQVCHRVIGEDGYIVDVPVETFAKEPDAERYAIAKARK